MALKWGIITTGVIADDFVNAMSTWPLDKHKVVAVAARDGEKAKEFALKFDIPKSYEGYEKLAKDPDVGKL